MSGPKPSSLSLDEALRLSPVSPSRASLTTAAATADHARFDAHIQPGWDIRGVPHGGYLLALVAAAAAEVGPQPDPVSVSANYLAPPHFGPAQLDVTTVRTGKRQSVRQVSLCQDGAVRVHATVTLGTLQDHDSTLWASDAEPPLIPGPDQCSDIVAMRPDDGGDFPLHERVALRLHPNTGWLIDGPTGTPELDGWVALADERPADALALLVYSDGFPPSIFEALGTDIGHVPTVQLTTHLFALPAPGWVQSRCRTRVQGGGFVDEDADLWDANGRMVGTARQLAMLRPPG